MTAGLLPDRQINPLPPSAEKIRLDPDAESFGHRSVKTLDISRLRIIALNAFVGKLWDIRGFSWLTQAKKSGNLKKRFIEFVMGKRLVVP